MTASPELPVRRPVALARTFGSAPFALALVCLLLATTVWTRSHAAESDATFDWVSTNVHNLSSAPIRSFVLSALFLTDGHWLLDATMLAAVLVPLERRIGSRLSVVVFGSAHVLATMLTEGWIWLGIRDGHIPRSAEYQQDVGISYGMYGVAAAVLFFLPGRLRYAAVAVLAGYLGIGFALSADMTSTGHLLSLAIGLLWWPVLARLGGRSTLLQRMPASCWWARRRLPSRFSQVMPMASSSTPIAAMTAQRGIASAYGPSSHSTTTVSSAAPISSGACNRSREPASTITSASTPTAVVRQLSGCCIPSTSDGPVSSSSPGP
ncbi:MAG: hypothetical protein M3Y42_07480 [Actinomycetota bacterium]|nr:hypothetical protein [Actinomycetota bacterium]